MANDDQLAFILRSLTQLLKDYGRQRDDMNVMSAMVFRLDDKVAASIDPDASCMCPVRPLRVIRYRYARRPLRTMSEMPESGRSAGVKCVQ